MALRLMDYADAFAAGPALVGGKAWSLARLARWGFAVPAGLAVTIDEDDALRADPALAPLFAAAGRLDGADLTGAAAAAALSSLRAAILDHPFAEGDLDRLDAALRAAGLADAPLAVRSSATGEDGERHAFAGIHDSRLNVRGPAQLARAIRHCLASLWTAQAIAYRRRFGIRDEDCRCALLICRMVGQGEAGEPVAAGVAFTADPADGNRDRIVIEAVTGLGDKLVSGKATPVRYRFAVADRGIEPLTAPDAPLSPGQALRLAHLAWRLHWACGDGDVAQDIEWAFDGEDFVLLQARPVTALPPCGPALLTGQPVLWSNANFKEVLPGVLTPFSWSLLYHGIRRILYAPYRAVGIDVSEGALQMRRFGGRAYIDLSMMQALFHEGFGTPAAAVNRDLGGVQPEIALPPGNPLAGKAGRRRLGNQLRLVALLWRLPRRLHPQAADILARARACRERDLSQVPRSDLAALWRSWQDEIIGFPSQFANCAAGVWISIAREVAARHLPPDRAEALLAGLLAGAGGVVSAEHGYRLQALAHMRAQGNPAFAAEWTRFLDEFGHRGFDECEMANPRWAEAPDGLRQLLDVLPQAPNDRESARLALMRAREELKALPPLARLLVKGLIAKARTGFALREKSKSCLVAVLGLFRHLALEAGRRLAADGRLEQADDVFFLSAIDLWAWLDGRWDGCGARALVRDRKRQRAEWQAQAAPPDVMIEQSGHAAPPPLPDNAPTADGAWQGIAAAPGQARGRACLVRHPGDGAALQEGGILVAPTTDPGWTPLFLLAQGIVVETGGYLSHGAIVAREFGIPAVVNLPGIMGRLHDGEMLEVDGRQGRVRAL